MLDLGTTSLHRYNTINITIEFQRSDGCSKIGLAEDIYRNKRIVFKKGGNSWTCHPNRCKRSR